MTTDPWWILRGDYQYVSAASYADREGLTVRWTEDGARALRLPTLRAARALQRAYVFPGARPYLRVVKVTRTMKEGRG